MHKDLIYTTKIPEGVDVKLDGKTLIVKGERGENKRSFHYPKVDLKVEDDEVSLSCKSATKNEKSIMGVFSAHINNMLRGVKEGFIYKLKICSGHFPMNAEVKGNKVIISNFLGEKKPRTAKIIENVKVSVDGDLIIVEGYNKESTGQTSANIEKSTNISNRDKRVFQDGIFMIDKGGKLIH